MRLGWWFLLLAAAAPLGCDERGRAVERVEAGQRRTTLGREPLEPLPAAPVLDPTMVQLGRRLFHDKRLSQDDSVACASCHDLAKGGVDGKPHSSGIRGQIGRVNAPSVFNASLNFVQFWDGRAATLEEQAGGPVTNPAEMGSQWDQVLPKLKKDEEYSAAFAKLFRDGVTEANVRHAIATFERTLLTRGSAFDRWLEGDAEALSPAQKSGYELFKAVGCIACHQGRNVGGNMFQRFGVFGDYFKDRGNINEADYGRFNVTHNEADRFVFRVPSLRNVAHTAPYFHDGSRNTLPEAVGVMAKYQLGRALGEAQVTSIVAFLESLSAPEASASASR